MVALVDRPIGEADGALPGALTQAPLSSRVSSSAVGMMRSSMIASSTGSATSRRIIPKAWRTEVVCRSSPMPVSTSYPRL